MREQFDSTTRRSRVLGLALLFALVAVLLPPGDVSAQENNPDVVTVNGILLADGVPLSGWTVEAFDILSVGGDFGDVVTAADGTFAITGPFQDGSIGRVRFSLSEFTGEEENLGFFLEAVIDEAQHTPGEVWQAVLPAIADVELRVNAADRPAYLDVDTEFHTRHLWFWNDFETGFELFSGFQGVTTDGVYVAPAFVYALDEIEAPFFEVRALADGDLWGSDEGVWGVNLTPWNGVDPVYIDVQPAPHVLYWDEDGDLYGIPESATPAMEIFIPGMWAVVGGDCNDDDATINPDASDIVGNGVDEDCDGADATPVIMCLGMPVTINMQTGASGTGTVGDDVILGTDGADVINSGAGNDRICAGDGDDEVAAGAGHDMVDAGPGDDSVLGQGGVDRLDGGTGNDYLYGGNGRDRLTGSFGNDRLVGGAQDDRIFGNAGKDTLIGSGDNDYLVGGGQDDRIYGIGGDDTLIGNHGTDQMFGGDGDDVLDGRTDVDSLIN